MRNSLLALFCAMAVVFLLYGVRATAEDKPKPSALIESMMNERLALSVHLATADGVLSLARLTGLESRELEWAIKVRRLESTIVAIEAAIVAAGGTVAKEYPKFWGWVVPK